jgi:hypothetical protein
VTSLGHEQLVITRPAVIGAGIAFAPIATRARRGRTCANKDEPLRPNNTHVARVTIAATDRSSTPSVRATLEWWSTLYVGGVDSPPPIRYPSQ